MEHLWMQDDSDSDGEYEEEETDDERIPDIHIEKKENPLFKVKMLNYLKIEKRKRTKQRPFETKENREKQRKQRHSTTGTNLFFKITQRTDKTEEKKQSTIASKN